MGKEQISGEELYLSLYLKVEDNNKFSIMMGYYTNLDYTKIVRKHIPRSETTKYREVDIETIAGR